MISSSPLKVQQVDGLVDEFLMTTDVWCRKGADKETMLALRSRTGDYRQPEQRRGI